MAAFEIGSADLTANNDNSEHVQNDVSTSESIYMKLCLEVPDDLCMHHCVIERNIGNATFFGKRPDAIYSMRFGSIDDYDDTKRIWAQRRVFTTHPFYSISIDKADLERRKEDRSPYFLGKLKTDHDSRLFTGFRYFDDSIPDQLVAVVYEHERNGGERKMEVGLPSHTNINLREQFMKIRHEGAQNLPQYSSVTFYHQKYDDKNRMQSSDGFLHFHSSVRIPSTKNFELIRSSPFRKQSLVSNMNMSNANIEEKSDEVKVNSIVVDGTDPTNGENWSIMQFGKIDANTYSCSYRAPLSPLVAFMIALSRFETAQLY
jgi:hypothetical protein